MTDSDDIERQLLDDLMNELLTNYLPHRYGLPPELDEDKEFFDAWSQFQWAYAKDNAQRLVVQRLVETNDLPDPGSEKWDFMIHETAYEFDEHVTSTERMSLTVPIYIPYLVRHLAEGPRQMGEAITKLIVQAFVKKPEPQGILERIERRLNAMESRLRERDATNTTKG